ncbi:hypothetical protein BC832DRAFT_350539 [Gaertneriomyces semiglobifer]|nr:hypothetical protein BC832DRAFT_350539 [Gaertneriomyces semiglobifer]
MASRPNMPQGGFMPQQQQAIRPPGVPVQNTMPPASVMQQQQQPTQQQPPQQPPHPRPLPPHHHLQQQGPPPTGGAAMPNSPAMFRPNQQQQIRPNISQAMAQGVRPPMPVGGTGQPFRPPGESWLLSFELLAQARRQCAWRIGNLEPADGIYRAELLAQTARWKGER